MLIAALTKNHLPNLHGHQTIDAAIATLEDIGATELPLVDADEFIGTVRLDFLYDQPNPQMPLQKIAHLLPRPSIKAEHHLLDAFAIFHEHRAHIMAVENAQNQFIGTLEMQDLVFEIGKHPALKMPGGIIVLEMAANDYHLSQIAQIFEADDAKILTLLITETPENFGWIDVTIKSNKTDISGILQTLSRYNYIVKAVFHQGEHERNLRHRYEALMNYLNM